MSSISLDRPTPRQRRLIDSVCLVVLFGFALLGAMLRTPGAEQPGDAGTAALLAGLSCVALLGHRRHPRIAVAGTTLCAAAASALGYLLNPLLLTPVMAALYAMALRTDRRTTRVHLFATAAVLVTTAVAADPVDHPLILRTIGPMAWVLLPVVAGTASRLRGKYLDAVQARAEYAERTREEEARLRVTEERMRIARDLHDVVAHHLALANAQAGTAAHLARTRPEQAEKILTDLAGTTASALCELKATVGLLRQADDPDTSLQPAPGLARLPELTAACRAAGVEVTVTTEGEPRPLSPGVDLTAFRIVQEALTNVTKHAAAGAAHIRLRYSGDRLTVTVTDDGTGTAPADPGPDRGFGLIGMRERAQSVGGVLQAGHRREGGFEVTTELPLHLAAPD
ncbi:sensor histidine kinase, partial [Streptomyces spongiae]